MKLSSRAIYGIRVCSLISTEERTPVALSLIAEKSELSEKYLEQILGSLVKGGVLVSTRGVNGGYSLARNTSEISLLDILVAVDDVMEVGCGGKCDKICPDKATFVEIENKINDIFKSSSLESITLKREEQ
ncbi:MAG: Rrf2 family transcriptional regulator [Clostridia bacterium]|nr:Rrf2 family transcriptional regulator [Clostridia bacterium]